NGLIHDERPPLDRKVVPGGRNLASYRHRVAQRFSVDTTGAPNESRGRHTTCAVAQQTSARSILGKVIGERPRAIRYAGGSPPGRHRNFATVGINLAGRKFSLIQRHPQRISCAHPSAPAVTGAHRAHDTPTPASCIAPTAASVFDLHRRALTSHRPNGCRANRAFRSRTSALRPVVAPSARPIGACASRAGVSASALHLVAVLSAPDPIPLLAPDPRALRLLGDSRNPSRILGGARRRRGRRRRSSSVPLRS